jgi:hypothetical protein
MLCEFTDFETDSGKKFKSRYVSGKNKIYEAQHQIRLRWLK